MTQHRFSVPGIPRPQGSKRIIRGRLVEVSKYVRKWRREVSAVASTVYDTPTDQPLLVELTFTFERPKSHLTSKGILKSGLSEYHVKRPDVDKLIRAILDSLTGIAYVDDSQVVSVAARKQYGNGNGVDVVTVIL